MYQKLVLIGNLGRDPELRFTPSGSPVASFSLAVNRKSKATESTTWFKVTAWGSLAEACNQYLRKGRQCLVEGELRGDPETGAPRVWLANDGTTRSSFEVTAHVVKFLQGGQVEEEPEPEQEEMPF